MTGEAGFGTHLTCGILRWDKVTPFPAQDAGDRRTGDQVISELSSYLVREVSPARVDSSGALPARLLADLGSRGLLSMRAGAGSGGLGLSLANTFRAVQTAASWSCAAGTTLAIQNGIGAGAHLPAVPPGPLRDLVTRHVAAGMVSGSADTEAAGAANRSPGTTATATSDGAAYILNGEKIFVTNAPVADLLCVSAAVRTPSGTQSRIFFVDCAAAGVSVGPAHDFMGQRGTANAVVRLRQVRVPRDRMLTVTEDDWRLSERLSEIGATGRLLIIVAPSLAIAKLCLHWQREFTRRRTVDGRPLGGYEEVQRIITASLADVLAMSSVIDWCLLAKEADLAFERYAVKNIASLACWRVVERTMSLLAAEGYETAASKARRGGQPLPLERFYRDARMLRIGGGVDFQVDNWGAQSVFERCFLGPRPAVTELPLEIESVPVHPRNRDHLRLVAAQARSFAAQAAKLTAECGDSGRLFERESMLINLHRIASELLTMAIVVAKSSGQQQAQGLADAYCTAARLRLRGYWQRVSQQDGPDYAGISRAWLAGEDYGSLLGGVITQTPPVTDRRAGAAC